MSAISLAFSTQAFELRSLIAWERNMSVDAGAGVTRLLLQWTEGDKQALEDLLPLVYDELRRLAKSYLQCERSGHTLQSTALVHEAYMRLVDQNVSWQRRA